MDEWMEEIGLIFSLSLIAFRLFMTILIFPFDRTKFGCWREKEKEKWCIELDDQSELWINAIQFDGHCPMN